MPRPAANGAVQQAIAFCDVLWPNNFFSGGRTVAFVGGSGRQREWSTWRRPAAETSGRGVWMHDSVRKCVARWPPFRHKKLLSSRLPQPRFRPLGRRMRNASVVAETNHHLRHYGSHLRLRTAHYQPCCFCKTHLLLPDLLCIRCAGASHPPDEVNVSSSHAFFDILRYRHLHLQHSTHFDAGCYVIRFRVNFRMLSPADTPIVQ